jgi:predicted RNA-binding protein Jag
MAQALFWDNRVLWMHFGHWPSADDRFYSDLRQPEKVRNAFIRELTEAAMSAPIPVIMGGHSLVSGDMYVLVDMAWEVAQVDMGRVIGKDGRVANAMRVLVRVMASRQGKRINLDIV